LLSELDAAGYCTGKTSRLINALGTHRKQTEVELRGMLGDWVMDRYRCLQHDAFDDANLSRWVSRRAGIRCASTGIWMEAMSAS